MGETETMKQKEKYYNQRQIADILSVSKATASRYLNKLDVSYTEENGAKLYPETVLKQLKSEIKSNKATAIKRTVPTATELLQNQVEQLQEQIKQLKDEIQILNNQLKIKDEQIKTANKIADQAQQLNRLDKTELPEPKIEDKPEKKKHWWQK